MLRGRFCCNRDQNSSRSGQWTHFPIRLYLIGCIAVHFQNDNSNLMLTLDRVFVSQVRKIPNPSLIRGVFTSKSKFYSFTLFNNQGYFSPPPICFDKYYRAPTCFNNDRRTPIPLSLPFNLTVVTIILVKDDFVHNLNFKLLNYKKCINHRQSAR